MNDFLFVVIIVVIIHPLCNVMCSRPDADNRAAAEAVETRNRSHNPHPTTEKILGENVKSKKRVCSRFVLATFAPYKLATNLKKCSVCTNLGLHILNL